MFTKFIFNEIIDNVPRVGVLLSQISIFILILIISCKVQAYLTLQSFGGFGLNFLNLTPPRSKILDPPLFLHRTVPSVHGCTRYTVHGFAREVKGILQISRLLILQLLSLLLGNEEGIPSPVFSKRSECYLENVPNPASRIYIQPALTRTTIICDQPLLQKLKYSQS